MAEGDDYIADVRAASSAVAGSARSDPVVSEIESASEALDGISSARSTAAGRATELDRTADDIVATAEGRMPASCQ